MSKSGQSYEYRQWQLQQGSDNSEKISALKRRLQRIIYRRLTERERVVYSLYYEKELSQREIAGKLDVSHVTVHRMLGRIRKVLYAALTNNYPLTRKRLERAKKKSPEGKYRTNCNLHNPPKGV